MLQFYLCLPPPSGLEHLAQPRLLIWTTSACGPAVSQNLAQAFIS
jgi:hypothetical protein